MSITKLLDSEEILIKGDKEYKRNIRNRLKELIAEGDEEAKREYSRIFPKFQFKASNKEDKQYDSRVLGRRAERIPYIVCRTCGRIVEDVREYEDYALKQERRKTWKRIVRVNTNYYLYLYNRKLRNRRIFFSYKIMSCLQKKHNLTLKFKEGKTIEQMGYRYSY